jgi:hypothetical protein
MSRGARRGTFIAVSVFLSLAISLLGLEAVLRLMPVSQGLRGVAVNDGNPVYRFSPNQTLRWSKGWNFSLVNEIHINNYGFISDVDYEPSAGSPLLAIIGDSFVEAAMVPYSRTAAGLLQRTLAGKGRVYSFGASGAALSQYLAYAEYVHEQFKPFGMVITIVGNDFDESLLKYRNHPGFHYFVETGEGKLQLQRIDRKVPPWKDVIARSAVGRYIVMNLQAGNLAEYVRYYLSSLMGEDRPFNGNVEANVDMRRMNDSKKAVDAFLDLLPRMSALPPSQIALVVDAPRPDIYFTTNTYDVKPSYFQEMRQYLMRNGSTKGFEIIDLEKEFAVDYQRRGLRFEYPHDYHWNETGHEVVASAIRQSQTFRRAFKEAT